MRLKAAKELGIKKIPVVYINLPKVEKEKELNLRLNRNTGEWDWELLKNFDTESLLNIGFDDTDLSHIWDESLEAEDDDFDVKKELEKMVNPKTKPGDLFQLGSHRLLCADSTNPESLNKLLGDEKATTIFSDPVYNIGLNYNSGIGGKQQYGGKVKDKRSDEEYKIFLKKSIENALTVSNKDVHIFYWCDSSNIWLVQEIYRELGIENKRVALWIKNSQNPTPDVAFAKCFEPCVYGSIGRPYLNKNIQNLNEVMNKEIGTGNRLMDDILDMLDIWLVKRLPGNEYQHPTMKPPPLYEKAIRRCTKPGDIILDSFAGSGSLLIAGEQLKRKVYLVEIEPIFCDLIIKRYEKITGQSAKKIN
jgi:DNA modification methylase